MLNKSWSRNVFHNINTECIRLEQSSIYEVCDDIWCTTPLWNIVPLFASWSSIRYSGMFSRQNIRCTECTFYQRSRIIQAPPK